jgi:hypothetical protein
VTEYAVLLVAVLAVVAAVWLAVERVAAGRLAVRARVLVNLHNGEAITGVLWSRRGRLLVLRDAAVMTPGQRDPRPVDGDVIVDRDQVTFVPRVGG